MIKFSSQYFDQCMLPLMSDGSVKWLLTVDLTRKLKIT